MTRHDARASDPVDAGRLGLSLSELRLPTIKAVWLDLAERADKEGWPAARFLATLAEHEMAERARRRIERHLDEARLPPGKTLNTFDFEAVPMVSKAQIIIMTRATRPGTTKDALASSGLNQMRDLTVKAGSGAPAATAARRPDSRTTALR